MTATRRTGAEPMDFETNMLSSGDRYPNPQAHTEILFAEVGAMGLLSQPVFDLTNSSGFALKRVEVPTNFTSLNQLLHRRPVSFLLGRAAPDTISLVDSTSILSSYFPPLVLMHDGPMAPGREEKMRRAGVAALVNQRGAPEVLAELVERLSRSWSWVRIPLGRIDVASAIQSLSDMEDELCLSVACPHAMPLSSDAWPASRACRGDKRCTGWYGRLYIRNGTVTWAETPQEKGIAAVATILGLETGQVLCHEVFLRPEGENVGMRVHSALLEAAAHLDHRSAGIPLPNEVKADTAPSSLGVDDSDVDEFVDFDEFDELPEDDAPEPMGASITAPVPAPTPSFAAPPPGTPSSPSTSASASIRAPVTDTPMDEIERFLRRSKDLIGISICDHQGWVEKVTGDIDAETVCAVATMATPQMQRIAALMGMGHLRQWAVSGKGGAVYTVLTPGKTIAAVGNPTHNLDAVLRLLHQHQRDVLLP